MFSKQGEVRSLQRPKRCSEAAISVLAKQRSKEAGNNQSLRCRGIPRDLANGTELVPSGADGKPQSRAL